MKTILLMVLLAAPLRAQAVHYVTLVETTEAVARQMERAYQPASGERLWCVTGVEREEHDAYTLLRVTGVQPVEVRSTAHHMALTGAECVAPNGAPLPTIHTHGEANCQASPYDIGEYLKRNAAFEGIQCGSRAKVWYFAWQLHAAFNPVANDEAK